MKRRVAAVSLSVADKSAALPEEQSAPAEPIRPPPAAESNPHRLTQQAVDTAVTSAVLKQSRAMGGLRLLPGLLAADELPYEDAIECFVMAQAEEVSPAGAASRSQVSEESWSGQRNTLEDSLDRDGEMEVDFDEWLTWIWLCARRRFQAEGDTKIMMWLDAIEASQSSTRPHGRKHKEAKDKLAKLSSNKLLSK